MAPRARHSDDAARPRGSVDPLAVSGLTQIALGAISGLPYAIATYKPELLPKLGIAAPRRIRQLHLDLIIMGGIVTAAASAVPGLPKKVAIPLAVGCWTNALAFAPPAVRPTLEQARFYRVIVGASFFTTTVSWAAVAVTAARRRWSTRP
jgi:hypothetical protein